MKIDLLVKGGLLARFLIKKENYRISAFVQSLFSTKKTQSCQFATYRRNALFEFLTSNAGQMAFPIFKVMLR